MTRWVYKQTEAYLWTVGHYSPDGKWNPESDCASSEEAADRVSYLNGGQVNDQIDDLRARVAALEDVIDRAEMWAAGVGES